MNAPLRALIPLLIFLIMVIFLWIGLSRDPREIPSPLIGKPAPAFELPSLQGSGEPTGPARFQGRVFLVNVFASWCASCRDEHPVLNALKTSQSLPILGLNYKDQPDAAAQWLARHGNPYEAVALDTLGRAAIDWGVYGVPETFVVDQKGLIRLKHTGPVTAEVLEREILPLVRQLNGETP